MNRQSQRERLRWKKKPFPELVRLAWPITVSMLSFSAMTVVDTLFVGRLGAPALAAVGLGGVTAFSVLCFGFGLLRAQKVLVALDTGAGRRDVIARAVGASLVVAVVLGAVIAVTGQLVCALLPKLTTGDSSGPMAASYAAIRIGFAPLTLLAVALREARHGRGDSRAPMRAALLGNVVNAPLDALFIFTLGLGVSGAAWATVLAQAVEAGVLVASQRDEGFGLSVWRRSDVVQLCRLGIPMGVERLLDAGAFAAMVALFAKMGDVELAAHQIALQVLHFCFLPGVAIGDATCVLVGQAVGAGELRVLARVQRSALTIGTGYMALCSALFVVSGPFITGWFTRDPVVTARAADVLEVAAFLVLVFPAYQIGQASLRGAGDVRAVSVITVCVAWLCTPSLCVLFGMTFHLGVVGGWIGLGLEIGVGAVAFWLRWRSGAWVRSARRVHDERRERTRTGSLSPAVA
jgi:MATE family multidrug resistance protein